VLGQQHAEVVVAHVRGEVVPHDAFDALVVGLVDDIGLQDLDQRKDVATAGGADMHFGGDDLEFDGVAVAFGVVPMRQVVEPLVDHPQRVAQVFLAAFAPGQVGEVGGDARVVRGTIVFIKRKALDAEGEIVAHGDGMR